jgi:hypothetical protein
MRAFGKRQLLLATAWCEPYGRAHVMGCPGDRAEEGIRFDTEAAPATVTGEPSSTQPLAARNGHREGEGGRRSGSQETCPIDGRSAPGG